MKDWETTLKNSLEQRWKRYRRALKRCRRKFSARSVHASRVETRRLLSLVELLGVFLGQRHLKKARRILKRHLDAFDPLRDTQVQLLLLAKHRRQFPEAASFHQTLIKREKRCLKTATRRLDRVKTRPLQDVFGRLGRQLARARNDATQRTRHRVAVVNAVRDAFLHALELKRAMDPGAAGTIHQTRVAFKKFRYMMETLRLLFSDITRERLTAMQEFQSMMGDVQDTEVFLARLDKHTRGHEARARTLARFRRWLMVRHTAQISYCLKHADRLDEFRPLTHPAGDGSPGVARVRRASPSR